MRLVYFTQKALRSMRASPGLSAVTVGSIAAALLVLAGYVMTLRALETVARGWGRTSTIAAYIGDSVPRERWGPVATEIGRLEGVHSATLVTPEQALQRFRSRGPETAALVEGVEASVLPAMIELEVDERFTTLTVVQSLAARVEALVEIESVDFGHEEFARLQALLRLLRYGGLGGGLLIALATAFIVSNTIRLTVYARREEIGILRLVGATSWFVRAPFVIEGSLWGLAGGVLGALALFATNHLAGPDLNVALREMLGGFTVELFALDVALGMVAVGIALGSLGSYFSVRRFLDLETL